MHIKEFKSIQDFRNILPLVSYWGMDQPRPCAVCTLKKPIQCSQRKALHIYIHSPVTALHPILISNDIFSLKHIIAIFR